LCSRIDYGYTASADFTIAEPKFLRITDIQDGNVDWNKVPGCRISAAEEASNLLADGDIVFARTGGTTGKSFLIRQPPKRAVFASYLIRLRPNESVLPDYLYAFFQSDDYWKQVWANARGGAQPNVNATLLGEITLPVLPLAQQACVSAYLQGQMSKIQRARKALEAQLDSIRKLPAALLREVFSAKR
jgi:type I restriction enzyme S subunit